MRIIRNTLKYGNLKTKYKCRKLNPGNSDQKTYHRKLYMWFSEKTKYNNQHTLNYIIIPSKCSAI